MADPAAVGLGSGIRLGIYASLCQPSHPKEKCVYIKIRSIECNSV